MSESWVGPVTRGGAKLGLLIAVLVTLVFAKDKPATINDVYNAALLVACALYQEDKA